MASYCSSSAPPRRRAFHHRCCLSSSSPHSLSPLSILPLCPYLLSEPSNKILLCYIFSTQRRRIDPAPCILVLGHSQRRSAAGEKMHENAATPPMVRPSWTYPFSPLSSFSLLYGAVFAPFLLHRCPRCQRLYSTAVCAVLLYGTAVLYSCVTVRLCHGTAVLYICVTAVRFSHQTKLPG